MTVLIHVQALIAKKTFQVNHQPHLKRQSFVEHQKEVFKKALHEDVKLIKVPEFSQC